jgi:hypothetical protein
MIDRTAFRFFLENGGYCTSPGRVACAAELARAESYARANGWTVQWEDDRDIDDSWMSESERARAHTWECALLQDESGRVLEALGGIVDADSAYRRVIAAELASEAMATALRAETFTGSLCWGV